MSTTQPERQETLETRMAQLERLLEAQQAQITDQQVDIAHLRAAPAAPVWTLTPVLPARAVRAELLATEDVSAPSTDQPTQRNSRRALLKLGGAAAAAGVAAAAVAVTGTGTVQAHRDAATITYTASGPGNIAIEGDGSSGAGGIRGISDSAFGVAGYSTSSTGMFGQSTSSGKGVWGVSNSSNGVQGDSFSGTGVYGDSAFGTGVTGVSTSGGAGVVASGAYGGKFYGTVAPLVLGLQGGVGAPASGMHYAGEIYPDGNTTLWVCVSGDGSGVGTWTRLTGVTNGTPGGALNYLSAPIRIFDSRAGQPAPLPAVKGALAGQSLTTIQVTGTLVGGLSVLAGATGVFGNLTVTNTQGPGDLILWPHGATQPTTSNINYGPSQTVANAFNVGLSAGGAMDLFVHVSGTDVIIDVAGYVL